MLILKPWNVFLVAAMVTVHLKLQSLSFASLSPSLFETLELQLLVELSSVCGLYSSTDPARMNLMFWGECVAVSVAVTDSSLRLGIYDPNKNFHCILPSEQVSNKSATFVLTNWEKKHYNKSLMVIISNHRLANFSSNRAKYYYCYTLFSMY